MNDLVKDIYQLTERINNAKTEQEAMALGLLRDVVEAWYESSTTNE